MLTTMLQTNFIEKDGVHMMAAALEKNGSLKTLSLRVSSSVGRGPGCALTPLQRNGIGEEGARALATALKQNCSLTALDLEVELQRWRRGGSGTDAPGAEQFLVRRRCFRPFRGGTAGERQPHGAVPAGASLTSLQLRAALVTKAL